ncbi:MAG: helix-hairpin-helix domain-containing protein [Ferruginibacter sp.]
MLKKDQHNYLNFTRKEKNGIIAILAAVLLFLLIPFLYPFFFTTQSIATTDYTKALDSLRILKADSNKIFYKRNYNDNKYHSNYKTANSNFNSPIKGELFYFDPNSLPVEGWIRMGVKEKTANTIQNYLSKGGKFRQPEDIKKIWGLRPDLLERIIPYVRIAQPNSSTQQYENKIYPGYEKKIYEKKVIHSIDINQGDSLAYLSLPGVGPSYARRIINFRNKLGGFYSIHQVSETFGLPDSTFQKIKPLLLISNEPVKKININTATQDEMKAHPYIRYQLANLLLQFRTQHGAYKSIDEIKKIMIVNDELFNKISPYLTVE